MRNGVIGVSFYAISLRLLQLDAASFIARQQAYLSRAASHTLDQRINSLRPGHEIELSRSNGFRVTAERSGCGKWLRFVRHHANGFEVIKTSRF